MADSPPSPSATLGKEFSLRRRRTRDEAVDGAAARRAYSDEEEGASDAGVGGNGGVENADDAGVLQRAAGYLASCFSAGSGGASGGGTGEESAASAWGSGSFPDLDELGDDPDDLFRGCDRRASAEAVGEELGLGQDLVKAQERLPPPLRRVRLDLWDARERAPAASVGDADAERPSLSSPSRGPTASTGADIGTSVAEVSSASVSLRDSAQSPPLSPKRLSSSDAIPGMIPGSPRRRARYVLHVLVLRASGLVDVQLIGPQDPYVRAAVMPQAAGVGAGGLSCAAAEAKAEAEAEVAGTVAVKVSSLNSTARDKDPAVSSDAQGAHTQGAPGDPEQEHWERTAYIVGGGTAPRWDDSTVDAGQEHKSHLLFPVDRFLINNSAGTAPDLDSRAILRLEVWNANLVTDERIGAAEVSLPPLNVEHSHAEAARQHPVALDTGGELLCRLYFSRNYYFSDEGKDDNRT